MRRNKLGSTGEKAWFPLSVVRGPRIVVKVAFRDVFLLMLKERGE